MPRFAFDFGSPLTLLVTLPLAVTLRTTGLDRHLASVTVENDVLDVRFGLLHLRTPVANVADATVTGPYNPLKALGVRLSLADGGVTYGTGYRRGLCIRFRRPVSGGLPLLTHPSLTVTVDEPDRLREALLSARDTAVDEAERLLAEQEPIAHPPAGRGRAVRDMHRAGTALEVVRPVETAPAQPTVQQAPVKKTAERPAVKKATPRKAAAKKVAPPPATATPADMPSHRQATPAESGTAAKTAEQEIAARRLAGNLPDDDGGQPTRTG